MKKIRVKGFAQIIDGPRAGQVVYLKEKSTEGYLVISKGFYEFYGYYSRKMLGPLPETKRIYLENMVKTMEDAVKFYQDALVDLDKNKE